MLKGAGVIGVGALAALAPTTAIAKGDDDAHGIEGSWLVTVTPGFSPGPPPFKGLWSFTPGGVFIATDAIDQLPQFSASPEHGAWVGKGEREFSVAAMKLLFDPIGNFSGTLKAQGVAQLDEGSDAFSGSAKIQLFDPTGKLFFSGSVAFQGTRIRV
jgi:hypothetical protein